jgi:hypothetical protein
MDAVPESETLPQNGSRLYHGTTMANARNLASGLPIEPLKSQADRFLRVYGSSFLEMESEGRFRHLRSFIFERGRETSLSVADTFSLAKSYALRMPEWQWYLFQFLEESKVIGESSQSWISRAEDFAGVQPNPAVVVMNSPNLLSIVPKEFEKFYAGSEISPPVPNPLPEGYEILQIVEIERI